MLVSLWVSPATALEPVVERAYQAGKQALDENRLEDALFHFKKALARADGASGTTWQMLLAVGVTYRDLGKPIFAREYFQRFLAVTEKHRDIITQKWRDRRETVLQTLAKIEPELSKTHAFVLVTSTPPGAAITVGGVRAGADQNAVTPFSLIVPGGKHDVHLSLEGHAESTHVLEVRNSDITKLDAVLEVVESDAVSLPSTPGVEPESPQAAMAPALEATVTVGHADAFWEPWVVIGSAGVLAIVGGAMTALGTDAQGTLDGLSATTFEDGSDENAAKWSQASADLDTYNMLSTTFYALAGAAALGGVVWLLLDDSDAHEEVIVAPMSTGLAPTQGGLYGHATWRF